MTTVLHVLEALEGGTARHVSDLVTHVSDVSHHVAAPRRRAGGVTDTRSVDEIEAAGGTVHRVEMRRSPASPYNAAALARLARLIRQVRPDVVHGHSTIGGALGRLAALGTGTSCLYTPNGLHPSVAAAGAERMLGPLTERFIAVSAGEARVAAARGIVPEQRISVIPNGVDLSPPDGEGSDLRARLGLDAGCRLVGFVGRLVPQKAPEVVVEAAARLRIHLPDTHMVMIGAGHQEAEVDALIQARGLGGSVHRLGHIPGAARLMGQLDVFALPSRYEGCPYAPLEAMRAGVPVVLSDVTGNRDVVDHGSTGLLTPVDDAASLAAALALVLEDAELRRRLTGAARAALSERFDVRVNAAAVAALYHGAAGS